MDPVIGTAEHRGPLEVHARAPGKIILAGEHAIVHGSAAVAAAIDLYTSSSLLLLPAGPARAPTRWSWTSGTQASPSRGRARASAGRWGGDKRRTACTGKHPRTDPIPLSRFNNNQLILGIDVEAVQFPLSPDDLRFAQVYRFVGDVLGSSVEAQLHRLLGAET
uniref:Mevalonate kinase n=1 Tax=Zea mays TaxID=4577 RepID=A0A804QKM1_MAIZE